MAIPLGPSTSENYYRLTSTVAYLCGAPNYYYDKLILPKFIFKFHGVVSRLIDIVIFVTIGSQWVAFFTQPNLSEKQRTDLLLYTLSHTIFFFFGPILAYHKNEVRDLSYTLVIKLKQHYNDLNVDISMVKEAKFYMFFYSIFSISCVLLKGADALAQVLLSDKTFVVIPTAWPDIDDKTKLAGIARVIIYNIWWLILSRMTAAYITVVLLTVCLSHQYKNLCSYFYSLSSIFEETVSHDEKERKYEEAVKLGINLHKETLRCARQMQSVCNMVYGGQIFVNIVGLVLIISQVMDPELPPVKTINAIIAAAAMLNFTGCIVWSAGNITIEASSLATAIFHSGWQCCHGQTARRVRSLLVISMCQSQKPVELKCLAVIKLSYEWYVSIVKTSYSVFSVFY